MTPGTPAQWIGQEPPAVVSTANSVGVPGCLVITATGFNAILALVNAHVTPLSPRHVVAAEVAIVAVAHVYALSRARPSMVRWYVLLAALAVIACVRALLTNEFEPKYFRDIALIPTFIVLGLAGDLARLDRTVRVLHWVVMIVLILELADNISYQKLFNIKEYYVNTRGFLPEEFWNDSSDLFVSATRPGERFIGVLESPRASSIFLEPVSLGNYAVVVAAYLVARYRHWSKGALAIFSASLLVILAACDGRLAVSTTAIILVLAGAARHIPARLALTYLPLTICLAVFLVVIADVEGGGDDFPGRVAHMVNLLGAFETVDWMGLSSRHVSAAMDSGFAYLIISQSLIGVILLWTVVFGSRGGRKSDATVYTHAIAIFLSLTMIVSYSIVSIKTAALLWFIFGVLTKADEPWGETGPLLWQGRRT